LTERKALASQPRPVPLAVAKGSGALLSGAGVEQQ
jgi:hypothetical protein